jgi:hypothetical protein
VTRPAPILLAAFGLAACTQTGAPEPASVAPGVTPSGFALPAGSGCAGDVARYEAIVENDLSTGHVARSVHDRIAGEIDRAKAACNAGRDAEASGLVAASRSRHGY